MIWILLLAFAASAMVTLLVIASAHRHSQWTSDHDLSGPQKMHANVVPRIGGLGIASGLLAGMLALGVLQPALWQAVLLTLVCAAPAFGLGLVEDLTKSVSPRRRLVAAGLSGLMGYYLLGAVWPTMGLAWVDAVLTLPGVMLVLSLIYVAGMVNAVNIIDGMNGLASMCTAIMMAALCYVALQVGDLLVAGLALACVGAALGFFIWNYPRGLVFLGDGGAYLLGFMVATLALLLCARNPEVSPLLPVVLPAYPIFETLFTMYRRRVLRGRPVSLPDGIHLHTLIYRRILRWALGPDDAAARTKGNSMTSPYLWVLSSVAVVPTALFWSSTPALLAALVLFTLAYLFLYWRIVRFRTPGWLTLGS